MEGQEEIISEIPSPPPYSTRLPSYDEISQSLSPLQTLTTSETDQTEQPNSQSDSALLPPAAAPPAYDEIIHPTTGGQPYNSPVQQPLVANVQQNQTHAESGEGLQQRIARRMAAIDAEIHQRSGQVTHSTVHSRNNVLPQQGSSHAREAAVHNQHSHRPNQPHHNSIQIPTAIPAAIPANVQRHQAHTRSNEGLQQQIERRMATIDEQMRQRQAGRTLGTSTTAHSRTNAYQQQGTPRAQPTTVSNRYSYQLNQPHHNIMQRPPAVGQSPRNVQQNQSDLQQRIAERMAQIDLRIRHQGARRALELSRTVPPRTDAYRRVRRNQSHTESGEGEGLQERIARRMAAIDEEIHQRQGGIMPAVGTSHASVTAQSTPNRPSQAPSHHNTGWQPMASTHSQQSSSTAANQSESSQPQGSNINTGEEDLQSRLEQRFAAIDNSIRRRGGSQENRQKDCSCFCFPFCTKIKD